MSAAFFALTRVVFGLLVFGAFGPAGVALGAAGVLLPVALEIWLLAEVWRCAGIHHGSAEICIDTAPA